MYRFAGTASALLVSTLKGQLREIVFCMSTGNLKSKFVYGWVDLKMRYGLICVTSTIEEGARETERLFYLQISFRLSNHFRNNLDFCERFSRSLPNIKHLSRWPWVLLCIFFSGA